MSDTADYSSSDARLLGTIHPSALTAQPESAAILPGVPPDVSQLTPQTAQPAQAQPDGTNAPTPMFDGRPTPTPQGQRVVPAPFRPARG